MSTEILTHTFVGGKLDLESHNHSYNEHPHEHDNVHGPECIHEHESHNLEELFHIDFQENKKKIESSYDIVYEATKIAVVLSIYDTTLSEEQKESLVKTSRMQGDHPYPFFKTPEEIVYNKKRDEIKRNALFDHKHLLKKTPSSFLAQNLLEQVQVPFDKESQDNFFNKDEIFNFKQPESSSVDFKEEPESFSYLLEIDGQEVKISVTDSLRILALDFAFEVSGIDISPNLAQKIKALAKILRDNDVTFSNFRSDDNPKVLENNLKIPEGHSLSCIETKVQSGDTEGLKEFTRENGEDTNGLHGVLAVNEKGEMLEDLCESHLEVVSERMEIVNEIATDLLPEAENLLEPSHYFFNDESSKYKIPQSNYIWETDANKQEPEVLTPTRIKKSVPEVSFIAESRHMLSVNRRIEGNSLPTANDPKTKNADLDIGQVAADYKEDIEVIPQAQKVPNIKKKGNVTKAQQKPFVAEVDSLSDAGTLPRLEKKSATDDDKSEPTRNTKKTFSMTNKPEVSSKSEVFKNIKSIPIKITTASDYLHPTTTSHNPPETTGIQSRIYYVALPVPELQIDSNSPSFLNSSNEISNKTETKEASSTEQETGSILERTMNTIEFNITDSQKEEVTSIQNKGDSVTVQTSEEETGTVVKNEKATEIKAEKDSQERGDNKIELEERQDKKKVSHKGEKTSVEEAVSDSESFVEEDSIVVAKKVDSRGKKVRQKVHTRVKVSRNIGKTESINYEQQVKEGFVRKERIQKVASERKSQSISQAVSFENSFAVVGSQPLQSDETKKTRGKQIKRFSSSNALALDSNNILDFSNPYAVKTAIAEILQKIAV